jgi:hypothetical protein
MGDKIKIKGDDGKKTCTIEIVDPKSAAEGTEGSADVEAYQATATVFTATGTDGRILTITIAE